MPLTWYTEGDASNITTAGSLKEDIVDLIVTISPTDTPFVSHRQRSRAIQVIHIAPYDELAARSTAASSEGTSWVDTTPATPSRAVNYTQIWRKDWGVSGTQEAVAHYGMDSPYRYYLRKALKELANNIEASLLTCVGTITGPRKVKGLAATSAGNGGVLSASVIYAPSTTSTFTENRFNTLCQTAWGYGADPDEVYVGPYLKRETLLKWTTNVRQVEADAMALYGNVDVYIGPFGKLRWYLSRDMTDTAASAQNNAIAVIQSDLFRFAVLREENIPLQRQGDQLRGTIITEGTLECRNPLGGALCLTAMHDTVE